MTKMSLFLTSHIIMVRIFTPFGSWSLQIYIHHQGHLWYIPKRKVSCLILRMDLLPNQSWSKQMHNSYKNFWSLPAESLRIAFHFLPPTLPAPPLILLWHTISANMGGWNGKIEKVVHLELPIEVPRGIVHTEWFRGIVDTEWKEEVMCFMVNESKHGPKTYLNRAAVASVTWLTVRSACSELSQSIHFCTLLSALCSMTRAVLHGI